MDVVVFGAGSLGSLLGGLLARNHDVTLVGRDPHVTAVRTDGLRVTGAFEFTVEPQAELTAPAKADLVLVTVKAFDTPTATDALANSRVGTCISLQNGMGNETILADGLDCEVLAGTCTYGAMLQEPGIVECTGIGEVVLGARAGGESETAQQVGRTFESAGIVAEVTPDMPQRLWVKLAVNAGINATTALARIENGALRSGPANEVATTATREVAQVARNAGVDLSTDAAIEAVERVADDTAANTSSMLQDVLAERQTEVDAISGYVVDHATEAVPVNATMAGLLRAWERERNLRE